MKRWPYRAWLLAVVIAALVIGCIGPESPVDMIAQHIPTVVALALLTWWGTKPAERRLSDGSFTLLAVFLLLHILGAHYLYSNVPYDDWSKSLTGRSLSSIFGWERNHYDRLVHFLSGMLFAPVMFECGRRFAGLRRGWAFLLAVGTVSIIGNAYEVIEWIVSLVMFPEDAEQYNGQQGDVWDPQKDLALSFVGSVLAAALCVNRAAKKKAAPQNSQRSLRKAGIEAVAG